MMEFTKLNPLDKSDVMDQFLTGIREAKTMDDLSLMGKYISDWNPDEQTKQSLRILWEIRAKEINKG